MVFAVSPQCVSVLYVLHFLYAEHTKFFLHLDLLPPCHTFFKGFLKPEQSS